MAVRTLTRSLVVGAVVLAGTLTACGSDTGESGSTDGTGLDESDVRPLPPNDSTALAQIYDPLLEPLGLRVTRGSLVDRSDGGYEVVDAGTHLALYVEPTGEYTDDDFLSGVWDVTALVTPDVFARYTELESYDICQEPMPTDDDRPVPPPVSQIDITREAAAKIDWAGGSLPDLIAASQRGEVMVRVDETLAAMPGWAEATRAATATATAPPSSEPPSSEPPSSEPPASHAPG